MSPLALHLIREGIADLKASRDAAAVELTIKLEAPGVIRAIMWQMNRDIERLEEDLAVLEFMAPAAHHHLAEGCDSLLLPGFH